MPVRKRKSSTIKCLSVRQPWASLIVNGTKTIENRSWRTHYRGPLLIHASRTVDRDACREHGLDPDSLPTGVILGSVTMADCKPPEKPCRSKWATPGLYHWLLTNPRRLRRPVPFTGRVGFFKVPLNCLDKALRHSVLASARVQLIDTGRLQDFTVRLGLLGIVGSISPLGFKSGEHLRFGISYFDCMEGFPASVLQGRPYKPTPVIEHDVPVVQLGFTPNFDCESLALKSGQCTVKSSLNGIGTSS